MKLMRTILVSSLILMFSSAYAADVGVATEMAEQLAVLKAQLEQLQSTYTKLDDTRTAITDMNTKLHTDLTGNFNVGDLYNDIKHGASSWNWTADTWEKELKELSGGNPERQKQLTEQYERYYPTTSKETFSKGASKESAGVYSRGVEINQAAMTEATHQFDDIATRLVEVNTLSKKIDTATTTKEALDLNSKLLSEMAYIQLEMLRMQTLVNQQMAHTQAASLVSQKSASEFNTLHLPTQ